MSKTLRRLQKIRIYPESDGRPVAEGEVHFDEMIYLLQALKEHFRDAAGVYVWGNLLFYYVPGDPRYRTAPDCFVARGSSKAMRRIWKVWDERLPCLIVEVTSIDTCAEDREKKKLYERLGVEEYILYDPLAEYLSPPLQGFQLVEGRYQSMPLAPDGSLASRTGVTLRVEDGRVRLRNTVTGEPLLRTEEKNQALRALEEEVARLRQELKS